MATETANEGFSPGRAKYQYIIPVENAAKKLVELVTHIAWSLQHAPHYGRTKVAKAMYHSDFRAYYHLGKPITGIRYKKRPAGPLPQEVYDIPNAQAHLSIRRIHWKIFDLSGYTDQILSTRDWESPSQIFTSAEIAIIDKAIEELKQVTNTEASRRSHGIAWKINKMDDGIPYEAVFIAEPDTITADDLLALKEA